MLSLFLFVCFVIVKAQVNLPVGLDTHVCPQVIRTKRETNCILPDVVTPIHYKIELSPQFFENLGEKMIFESEVRIQFVLTKTVPSLTFHSRSLKFRPDDITLYTFETQVTEFTMEQISECDFVSISKLDYVFERGVYGLHIKYSGIIEDYSSRLSHGIFRGHYRNNTNENIWFLSTRLRPTFARTVFPCFDEPKYKATFQLIINHGEGYKAISNTPILKNTSHFTEFMRTPSMPTYLLSFTVCDFANVFNSDNFTVYVRPDLVKYVNFSLTTATRIFQELDKYFDFQYQDIIDKFKLDFIGLPDFPGAIASFGLINYNENYLIHDENNPPSASTLEHNVVSIAKEIVQQWFGNFVTIKDWKYAWINGGIKIFLAYDIVNKLEPKWRVMDHYIVKDIQSMVLDNDSKRGTYPLESNMDPLSEFLSHHKGAAIIRMMKHFLGEEIFHKGLKLYLRKNTINPVDSNDFLDALQEEVNKAKVDIKVKKNMKSWLEYQGYPIINVTRDYTTNIITLGRVDNSSKKESEWYIPITYATKAQPNFNITKPDKWMHDSKMTIPITVPSTEWIILNKKRSGYYRVNYDEKNWNLIIGYLKSDNREKIHVLNRAQLMEDALTFVKNNQLNLKTFLSLTTYLRYEDDYIAWYPALSAFTWLDEKLINTEHYQTFKKAYLTSLTNWTQSLGYEEKEKDDNIIKISRKVALDKACSLGDPSCLKMMKQKLLNWFHNKETQNKTAPPDYEDIMFCHGVQNSSFLWHKSYALLQNTKDDRERLYIVKNLGCSRNKTILKFYLKETFHDDSGLLDQADSIITTLLSISDVAFDVAFEFILENYMSLVSKYINQNSKLEILNKFGEKIRTKDNLAKLRNNKSNIPIMAIEHIITTANANMNWIKKNEAILKAWFLTFNRGVKFYSASVILTWSSLFITLFCRYIM